MEEDYNVRAAGTSQHSQLIWEAGTEKPTGVFAKGVTEGKDEETLYYGL